MPILLSSVLSNVRYIPHGHCYLWQTPLVGLHVAADALIAVAYYLIPIFLIYFVRQVEELPFKNIFILFGAFILSCGTTHLLEIWTLWHPDYWVYGIFKAFTALISLYTAFTLFPLIPLLLNLSSPKYLQDLNQRLNEKIASEENTKQELIQLNQELEERIKEKTHELIATNQELQASVKFNERITNSVPNLLYIYDLATNRNLFCNPFIQELLGYSAQQIKQFENSILEELIHPDDIKSLQQHHSQCLALEDDDCVEVEYRIRDINGEWHWLHDKNIVFSRNQDSKPEQILGVAQDITQSKKTQLKINNLNQKLKEKITVLETKDRFSIHLSQMNRLLQVCGSLDEAKEIVADLLQTLFPDTIGIVYLMKNSRNTVDAIAAWGENICSQRHFSSQECWAIRLGNPYLVYANTPKLYCSHVNTDDKIRPSLCLPMIVKGETIGMLHLQFKDYVEISRSTKDLAETTAQNLALCFANLKLQQKLKYQSLHDPLTGLHNRRYLEESLKNEIDRARRKQQFISVMMLDVDHFKRLNDTYGHRAGDLVLNKLGAYLLSAIRQYDIACRYGGEELIIVMPDASIEDTIIRAEKIRSDIKNLELEHDGKRLKSISVSIGVSCFPDDGIDAKSLTQAADKALYQAKEEGRDRVKRC